MKTLFATVTAIALSMAVTVAFAASTPLEVGTLLAYREPVALDVPDRPDEPEPVLVDGFGDPAPGDPLAPPWAVPAGTFVWTADGGGVAKPGGQNGGANIAVRDVGARDVRIATTVAGMIEGPGGGNPTRSGLTVLSDGAFDHVLVGYARRTGVLSVTTPAGTLASVAIGSGRSAMDTIEVEVRFPELRISVDGSEVLTVTTVPASFASNTHHGIYADRDNGAVFTDLLIQDLS